LGVVMLSRYQRLVKFRSRKVEGNLTQKVISIAIVIFHSWNLCRYLKV
jgi:hypothetical protein